MISRIIFLFIVVFIFIVSANATENNECERIESANDVLQCAIKNHYLVQIKTAEVVESDFEVLRSKQRPNPDLDLEGVKNTDNGSNVEFILKHTFELGGKRSARMEYAKALKQNSLIDVLNSKEDVAIQTVLDLYRLRQLDTEFDILEENIFTFKKVKQQYDTYGNLNPEQEISVSVFDVAIEENKLRKNSLTNEKASILNKLKYALGKDLEITANMLPRFKAQWPKLNPVEISGSQLQEAENLVNIQEANLNIERSLSLPDLSLGPKIELDEAQSTDVSVGLALSVPLPIYQRNDAGKHKAHAALKNANLKLTAKKRFLEMERSRLYEIYEKSTNAIQSSLVKVKIAQKHEKLHEIIDRGVIEAPLIIDLHKEIYEYYQMLHEQEIQSAGAMWNIFALEGRILKEELR
jgi:outer membrane protein, heavy metal efflux system